MADRIDKRLSMANSADVAMTYMMKLTNPAQFKRATAEDKDLPELLKRWEKQNPEHVARLKEAAKHKKSK